MYYKSIYLWLIGVVLLTVSSCKKKETYHYFDDRGKIFSTTYKIKYNYTRSLKEDIDCKLQEFDQSLNPFKSNSIISKVNNNEEVVLDTLFINVFNRSQQISKLSGGLFDITVSPLIDAWGFGFQNFETVNQHLLDSLKQFVGYEKIKIEGSKIQKTDERVNINTSAIAKGYAVDVIAYLLDSYGIKDYMVEIGGEVRTKGVNEKGECWKIAVIKPLEKNNFNYDQEHTQVVLDLCNKSLATSGNYFKYYIKDGSRYAHTIDPRTAYPSRSNILSATVIADDCMTADAYATVFMLADTLRIKELAAKENLAYMLITSTTEKGDLEIIESENFRIFLSK